MPYVDKISKQLIDDEISVQTVTPTDVKGISKSEFNLVKRAKIISDTLQTDGDLNFIITRICLEYLNKIGTARGKAGYAEQARIVAAMECAKLEFYARRLRPYEEMCIIKNGDIDGYEEGTF